MAFAILNQGLDGTSLIVQGSPGNDDLHVSCSGALVVSSGHPIFAGERLRGGATPTPSPAGARARRR